MSDNNELDLFREMMADVSPIKQDTVEVTNKFNVTDAQLARQLAAQTLSDSDPEYLSIDYARWLNLTIC